MCFIILNYVVHYDLLNTRLTVIKSRPTDSSIQSQTAINVTDRQFINHDRRKTVSVSSKQHISDRKQ